MHNRIYHTGNMGKCPGALEQKGALNDERKNKVCRKPIMSKTQCAQQ